MFCHFNTCYFTIGQVKFVFCNVFFQLEKSQPETPATAEETHPELVRFYKMVQFGVPVPAVKVKMQLEGFDPNLLTL